MTLNMENMLSTAVSLQRLFGQVDYLVSIHFFHLDKVDEIFKVIVHNGATPSLKIWGPNQELAHQMGSQALTAVAAALKCFRTLHRKEGQPARQLRPIVARDEEAC